MGRSARATDLGATAPCDVTLIFIDLDGFKAVNDRHGHAAGDAVLAAVGGRLAALVRPQDVVARFGGDEFAMLYPGIDADGAAAIARRIAESIRVPVSSVDGSTELVVGASIGIASSLPDDTTIDSLLERADQAMYAMKAERRADTSWEATQTGGR